mmetsp:Transcript_116030/g.201853  ORF Transcript_116030/g.201853 Transcript_116030/m.201853 type:complete len:96 (+) Transcript_116030:108-395(+)
MQNPDRQKACLPERTNQMCQCMALPLPSATDDECSLLASCPTAANTAAHELKGLTFSLSSPPWAAMANQQRAGWPGPGTLHTACAKADLGWSPLS